MDSSTRNIHPNVKFLHDSCQGSSPFFHFLCGLSPIKPIRSGHAASSSHITTYSELSSPPPVFVSPYTKPPISSQFFPHSSSERVPLTNESTEHNQALKQEVECSLTSPNVSITTNLTGNTSSLTQQEEAGRHNCAFIPINEKKIVNGSLEEASPRSPSKVLEDLSNPDLYVLDGINQCIANDSKNFEPSCSDSPSEQLSKILASMRGRMVEENARKRLNFNAGSCMDNNSHNNEFQDGCNEQFCRAAMAGIRRRVLDFETLINEDRPISDLSMAETPNLASSSNTHSQDNNMPLLSQCTNNEGQSVAPRNDASYLPLPLTTHHIPMNTSHELPLPLPTVIEKSIMDGLIDSSSINGDISLGRVLSLVERITMNHQDGKSLLTTSPYVGIGTHHPTMAFNIDTIEGLLNATDLVNGLFPGHDGNDTFVEAQDISHQLEIDQADSSQYTPISPKKKRKLSNQEEGCKNCKCKKSKCLKLYCECFAAGVYCIGSCSCSGCLNKPEFKDIVLGKRQQIESRNPLAFAPKIILAADKSSPMVGEERINTPASLPRHKRGCNCKKSQCSKKYCECYQAGVGCGEGCRCEGCANIFGRNESHTTEKDQQTTSLETRNSTNEEITPMNSRATPEHQPAWNGVFSPITPYLDHSHGQCKSYAQSRSTEEKDSQSPFTLPLPTMPDFNSPCRVLESLERIENLGQMHLNVPSNLAVLPNKITITDLTDHCVGSDLNNNYSLYKPLPQISSEYSIFPSNYQCNGQEKNALTMPLTPHMHPDCSLSRRNYDFEEMSTTPLRSVNWLSDEENNPNILNQSNNHGNITPDKQNSHSNVLYGSNSFCAPQVVLKTRSPQQKRVLSYPHNPNLRDINSSRQSGFKIGRKTYTLPQHHHYNHQQQDLSR